MVLYVSALQIRPILRQGLAELATIDGRTIIAEPHFGSLGELPARLSKHKVDVILAAGPRGLRAASQATRVIPIVASDLGDRSGRGWLRSQLHAPGGNITEIFLDQPELAGKWLQYLSQAAPAAHRIAAMWDPGTGRSKRAATENAAPRLGVQVFVVELRPDLEATFAEVRSKGAQALVFLSSPAVSRQVRPLSDFALKDSLPRSRSSPNLLALGLVLDGNLEAASLLMRYRQGGKAGPVLCGPFF